MPNYGSPSSGPYSSGRSYGGGYRGGGAVSGVQAQLQALKIQRLKAEEAKQKRTANIMKIGMEGAKAWGGGQASREKDFLSEFVPGQKGVSAYEVNPEYTSKNWLDRFFTPADQRVRLTEAGYKHQSTRDRLRGFGVDPSRYGKDYGEGIMRQKSLWQQITGGGDPKFPDRIPVEKQLQGMGQTGKRLAGDKAGVDRFIQRLGKPKIKADPLIDRAQQLNLARQEGIQEAIPKADVSGTITKSLGTAMAGYGAHKLAKNWDTSTKAEKWQSGMQLAGGVMSSLPGMWGMVGKGLAAGGTIWDMLD